MHQLATATPVTILVTMRSETPAPDPIVALWKDTVAERFEIQALSRKLNLMGEKIADVEDLLREKLGRE